MLPCSLAERFAPVGLELLEAEAALRDRTDVKYVVPRDLLGTLADRLRATHRVLEIEGLRAFAYDTTYYDTPDLRAYRDHLQRRRRRFKCRARDYVDSGLCAFEVKLKGPRGRTVKHRMEYAHENVGALSEPALRFLRDCVERSYGHPPDGELHAAMLVTYTRVTLAAPELGERLTVDFDLAFRAPGGAGGRMADGDVIVESKSPRGAATAERALRGLGVRPVAECSKYCLATGLTRPEVNSNPLRPLLRRHFERT
jgi:VTC domain